MNKPVLYLIPNTLGDTPIDEIMPGIVKNTIEKLTYFIVENEKTARKFIKQICPEKKQSELVIFQLDKHDKSAYLDEYIAPMKAGNDIGLLSEAGLPAVADPGNLVVQLAHRNKIAVKPLVGPSSLMLALMASGLNGQKFTFHGYLPKDGAELKRKLKFLEQISGKEQMTQMFIETPYRNHKMLDSLLRNLAPHTRLCIATDLTLASEYVKTMSIRDWKKQRLDLHKRPTVFLFQSR